MFTLQTDRCRIEYLRKSHIPAAMGLFTDPAVREFLGGPIPAGYARQRLLDWCQKEDTYFAVMRQEDGTFLGIVDITPYHEPGRLELSYMFLPACWGQGYAEESIRAILQYCKAELHMNDVVSETQKKNIRSCKLLERLGYTLEKQMERFGAEQCVYGLTL